MKKNSELIFENYYNYTAVSALYQQNWMCDETILRILNSHYPQLTKTLTSHVRHSTMPSLPRLAHALAK
jgi:hypothetical protein